MSGGVVLVIVIVLFIFVIIGFNNEVKERSEARERKEASEKRIANLLRSLPLAQTKNDAYNIFSALSAEYQSFYNSGYYFQGYRQVDRIIAKAEKIYKTRCKELEHKPQKEVIFKIKPIKIKGYTKKALKEGLKEGESEYITSEKFEELRLHLGIMYEKLTPERNGKYIVYKKDLIEAEKDLIEWKETQSIFNNSRKHYSNGLEFEKNGEIDNAIEEYEKSISFEHTWVHSFVRLARIYEHREMYSDMVRVCKVGIKHHSGFSSLDNLINEINEKYVIDWDLE